MDKTRKLKKRPCSVCRRWFLPNPRVSHAQKTCGPECRKVWTARRQARWRQRNPDYDQDRRLRSQLDLAEQPAATLEVRPLTDPLAKVPWNLVQTAFGVKKAVIIAFALRLHHAGRQTAIRVKSGATKRSQDPLPLAVPQTAMEAGP